MHFRDLFLCPSRSVATVLGLCLSSMSGLPSLAHAATSLTDGPYVKWIKTNQVQVESICDGVTTRSVLSGTAAFDLVDPCTGEFVTSLSYARPKQADTFTNVQKYFAVSDVEGHYDDFVRLLQTEGIIDSSARWNWGAGHLVLLGDMVDRGDKVTEVLWLIHRLEQEAQRAGGHVHYVLGNHEKMTLEGDARYVNEKYLGTTAALGQSYQELFASSTELGRWLRSKPSLVKLDETLFVHAGLSQDILSYSTDISEINGLIQQGLTTPALKKSDSKVKWLLSSDGPLWYRGYFKDEDLSAQTVGSVLSEYSVKQVVVGHTIVPQIDFLHEGQVISIDTSFSKSSKVSGLLLEAGTLWRVKLSGGRERLSP